MRNEKESPNKFVQAALAVSAGVSALTGVYGAVTANRQRRNAAQKERKARQRMKRLENIYASLDTSNPFMNLENKMEDLTVNQLAAEFQRDTFLRSQANILSNLRSVAGGAGIAGLAQS